MILIVDFGSQTTHLIGRRLREMGVPITIVEPEEALSSFHELHPQGIILSGGPSSVYESNAPTINPEIFNAQVPILGICYGWQLTAHLLGGEVKSGHKEYGPAHVTIEEFEPLFVNIDQNNRVWVSHGDTVVTVPEGFHVIAQTADVKYAAVANAERRIYGVQFHPEVDHTVNGSEILKNFAITICGLPLGEHTIDIEKILENIRVQVGNEEIICAVSGGVDSTVTASLIAKAVGNKLHPIYVESGLMRRSTRADVERIFRDEFKIVPIIVEAQDRFLSALDGVADGEAKRKIIGKLYIDIFVEEAKKLNGVTYLAQGTIYSDVIESKGTKNADKIKSHHNVGGLPEELHMKLIEPLREFYKDEVRSIGRMIGLPEEFVMKQVFPGPGQAIRIVGTVTKERLDMQQTCDDIVVDEIKNAGLYDKVYMSFSIMTNTFSTAVKGDARQLLEVVAVRIIESNDVMTTDWAKVPYEVLQKISSRIVNEVRGVSRVVYDITTKPPATMEWE